MSAKFDVIKFLSIAIIISSFPIGHGETLFMSQNIQHLSLADIQQGPSDANMSTVCLCGGDTTQGQCVNPFHIVHSSHNKTTLSSAIEDSVENTLATEKQYTQTIFNCLHQMMTLHHYKEPYKDMHELMIALPRNIKYEPKLRAMCRVEHAFEHCVSPREFCVDALTEICSKTRYPMTNDLVRKFQTIERAMIDWYRKSPLVTESVILNSATHCVGTERWLIKRNKSSQRDSLKYQKCPMHPTYAYLLVFFPTHPIVTKNRPSVIWPFEFPLECEHATKFCLHPLHRNKMMNL